jgi:hypothetical protein
VSARRAFVAALALAAMAGWAGVAVAAMSPEERQALNAAERWLVPVDAGNSANAYAMTAADFKATVTREQWRDGMRDLRKPYGRVVLRKAEKLAYTTPDPKGAPGEKIVILFGTKFVASKTAEEEVTLVRENDGLWRVTGYYIR